MYTISTSLDEDRSLVWLVVVHCTSPRSVCSTLLYSIQFSLPSQFVLKTEHSHYVLENHTQKYNQGFHLTYAKTINITTNKHNQADANDSQCLIWMIWVCWLSPTWCTVCSQLMSLFDHYKLPLTYPTLEHPPAMDKSPAWNFSNHFWHIRSVTAPSYTVHNFPFRVSIAFLPFLK